MNWDEDTMWCDGCGVEITWDPIRFGKRRYCCQDCLEDRPCRCGERMEIDAERRPGEAVSSFISGGYAL